MGEELQAQGLDGHRRAPQALSALDGQTKAGRRGKRPRLRIFRA